jgi:hypothetical protein
MVIRTFSTLERLNEYLISERSMYEIKLITKDSVVLKKIGLKVLK